MISFFSKKKALLGIDISSSSIKVVELGYSNKGYTVNAFYILPFSFPVFEEGRILNIEKLGELIGRAVRLSGSKSKHVSIAIPASLAHTKITSFPSSLSDKEVEVEINHDAESLIPYSLDEVSYDFKPINKEQEGSLIDYLLAVTRNENIEERIDALSSVKLIPKIIDLETYATQNAYSLSSVTFNGDVDELGTIALFDIGEVKTTIFILVDGNIVFTRDQNFGGNSLLSKLELSYQISNEEARNVIRSNDKPEEVNAIISEFNYQLADIMERMISFYLSATTLNTDISGIALSGGCARSHGLTDIVENKLSLPASIVDPFEGMTISGNVDKQKLEQDAPSLMIACGLAMRVNEDD
jgi:type IV pilus assembly protein PilM